MMSQRPWWLIVLLGSGPVLAFGEDAPPYQTDFPSAEFQARWSKVFDQIGADGIALIQGAPKPGGFIVPRQSNEFYYLCGIETPHAYLVLDGRERKATLLLPSRDERLERAEGRILSAEDAEPVRRLTGVNAVLSTRVMSGEWMRALLQGRRTVVYTPFAPAEGNAQCRVELQSANAAIGNDFWDGRASREAHFVELLRTRFPELEVRDLTPIL